MIDRSPPIQTVQREILFRPDPGQGPALSSRTPQSLSQPGGFAGILQSYRAPEPASTPSLVPQVQVSGERPEPYQAERPQEPFHAPEYAREPVDRRAGEAPETGTPSSASVSTGRADAEVDDAEMASTKVADSEAENVEDERPAAVLVEEQGAASGGAKKKEETGRVHAARDEKVRAGEEPPTETAPSVPGETAFLEIAAAAGANVAAEGEELAALDAAPAEGDADVSISLSGAAVKTVPENIPGRQGEKKSAGKDVPEMAAAETALPEGEAAALRRGTALEGGTDPGDAETALDPSGAARLGNAQDSGTGPASFPYPEGAVDSLSALPEEGGGGETLAASGEGRDRRRTNLEVRDYRTGNVNARTADSAGAAKNGGAGNFTGGEGGGAGQEGGNEASLSLDLRSQAGSRAEAGQAAGDRPNFREILARELRGNLQGDIVRQASVLLRDNDTGVIRLTLRPESLGNVKIRLNVTENKITGQIVVESGDALRAFNQERGSLEEALRASGYDGASLEMSVAGEGGQNRRDREDGAPWASGHLASSYDDSSSWEGGTLSWADSIWDDAAVNVLV